MSKKAVPLIFLHFSQFNKGLNSSKTHPVAENVFVSSYATL